MEIKEHKHPFEKMDHPKWKEPEVSQVETPVSEPSDAEIANADVRDAAFDRVVAVLVKLGMSEADLDVVFSIEPSTVRKAKKPKKNKGLGQDKKAIEP